MLVTRMSAAEKRSPSRYGPLASAPRMRASISARLRKGRASMALSPRPAQRIAHLRADAVPGIQVREVDGDRGGLADQRAVVHQRRDFLVRVRIAGVDGARSEEQTSELQSRF